MKTAAGIAAILTLSGCLGEETSQDGAGFVARLKSSDQTPKIGSRASASKAEFSTHSAIVDGVIARRSVLPQGLAFDEVASAVLAANSRAAESQLRAQKLRANAASETWLPRIGSDISLTSLAAMIESLMSDAASPEHALRQAQRAFDKADIEVAAITLAQDSNDRVFDALELYLLTQAGREQSAVDEATLKQMNELLHTVSKRVSSAQSDVSELTLVQAKVAEFRGAYARNQDLARAALEELNAMAVHPLDSVIGLNAVRVKAGLGRPLSILKVEAEQGRAVAQAQLDHARDMPDVTAQAGAGDPAGAEFEPKRQARAIKLAEEAATRLVEQAEQNSARHLRGVENRIVALDEQVRDAAIRTREARKSLETARKQFDASERNVANVVKLYEGYVRQQEKDIALRYEVARVRLDLARLQGLLADGEAI